MKLIAHRGNVSGPNKNKENSPDYIEDAIKKGYDAEIDVWYIDGKLFLGHDYPQYNIEEDFLMKDGLWCHAKNIQALKYLLDNNIHCFWHQEDDFTITSKGYIWSYPAKILTEKSICLMPEWNNFPPIEKCFGICTDYVEKYI